MVWRPEGWVQPDGIGRDTPPMAYEAGADAIVVALMAHLRATAKENLDLAQSVINNDADYSGAIPWQLGRDATAYLVVADYIEKGQIRRWGMDNIREIEPNA